MGRALTASAAPNPRISRFEKTPLRLWRRSVTVAGCPVLLLRRSQSAATGIVALRVMNGSIIVRTSDLVVRFAQDFPQHRAGSCVLETHHDVIVIRQKRPGLKSNAVFREELEDRSAKEIEFLRSREERFPVTGRGGDDVDPTRSEMVRRRMRPGVREGIQEDWRLAVRVSICWRSRRKAREYRALQGGYACESFREPRRAFGVRGFPALSISRRFARKRRFADCFLRSKESLLKQWAIPHASAADWMDRQIRTSDAHPIQSVRVT
jgi:hypothetical protein